MSAIYRVTFKYVDGTKEVVEGDNIKDIMEGAREVMDRRKTTLLDLDVNVIPRGQRVGDA